MTNNEVTVIAEIGVNHNGDINLAKRFVDEFKDSGADYLKFQTGTPELILLDDAPKAEYQKQFTGEESSAMEMIRSIVLTMDQYKEMFDYVTQAGARFLSTAFDLPSVDFLSKLGLGLFKIPSGEITNLPYLRAISTVADEVILSTGMSELQEIEAAIQVLESGKISRDKITVLQCNTAYPSPLEDTHLNAMVKMGEEFGTKFGFSDHTEGSTAAIVAVGLGATVIEKHVTLDKNLPGPDQQASMEPNPFRLLVQQIRDVSKVLGNSNKSPTKSEMNNRHIARRGVYFAKDIGSGELVTMEDLICLRPENEFSPMQVDSIVGKPVLTDVRRHESVKRSDFA